MVGLGSVAVLFWPKLGLCNPTTHKDMVFVGIFNPRARFLGRIICRKKLQKILWAYEKCLLLWANSKGICQH